MATNNTEEWKKPSTIIAIVALVGTMVFNMKQCSIGKANLDKATLEIDRIHREDSIFKANQTSKNLLKKRWTDEISIIDNELRAKRNENEILKIYMTSTNISTSENASKRYEENINRIRVLEQQRDDIQNQINGLGL